MGKKVIIECIVSLFWLSVDILITFIISRLFLEMLTNTFIKIGLTKPSILESMDALFFICILSISLTLLIQKQSELFKPYNKMSIILLMILIIYLLINFISLIIRIQLPYWFTFPFRL
jgi:hypothetical protein